MISKILGKFIPLHYKKQLINFKLLVFNYGQYDSIKNWECIDSNGKKIPWYTYPAIEFLNNINFKNKKIFEYGSGNSSAYWAEKSLNITSVEHDEEWFQKIKLNLKDNQQILLSKNDSSYEKKLE